MDDNLFIEFDTEKEIENSLKKLDETLTLASTDTYQWKWAIIILHNCIQNCMILSLRATNDANIIKYHKNKFPKSFKDYINNLEIIEQAKIIDYLELYDRIKNEKYMKSFIGSKHFIPEEKHNYSMNEINEIRNNFIHFKPQTWLIEIELITDIFKSVVEIINFLIFESGNCIYRFNENQIDKIKLYITNINRNLNRTS